MRTSVFHYQGFYNNPSIHRAIGSCFQACKTSKFFSYDFLDDHVYCFNGKTKQESIDREVQLTQMLIKELKLDVVFQYTRNSDKVNTFSFSITKPGFYDLYSCVIMSRYFVSDVESYRDLITRIDYLVDRNYTPMEAYIIASLYTGDGAFSFSNKCLLDINAYRSISKKKETLLKSSPRTGMNHNFSKLCRYHINSDENLDYDITKMEDEYYKLLSEISSLDRMILVIDEDKLKSKSDIISNRYPGSHFHIYRNGRICIEQGITRSVGALHRLKIQFDKDSDKSKYDRLHHIGGWVLSKEHLESINLVDIKDFLTSNINYIKDSLTPTGKGISKRWPAGWLFDLHRSRNFNLVEEVNNLNLLPNKLAKWKK